MLRALWFLGFVGVSSFMFGWLADRPGSVVVTWENYRIDTSFFVLLVGIILVMILSAFTYRFWLFIRFAPRKLLDTLQTQKKGQGYKALTKGMVSVAAGDSEGALRQVKRAKVLLKER